MQFKGKVEEDQQTMQFSAYFFSAIIFKTKPQMEKSIEGCDFASIFLTVENHVEWDV